jgi:hypothetical protein
MRRCGSGHGPLGVDVGVVGCDWCRRFWLVGCAGHAMMKRLKSEDVKTEERLGLGLVT